MKVELTIKVDYLPDWGSFEGIRELIQNAKDAEVEFNAPMSVRVRSGGADEKGVLVIENEGCTMPYEALLLGHTTKTARGDLIGKFGEGLKLGILALLREGHEVKIRNGSEVWVPEIVMSEKFKARVLSFDIQGGRKNEDRVQIEISGITPEFFTDEIKPRFLWLDKDGRRKDERVETGSGTLLLSERYKGRIFVKGIFVENRPDLSVGYDFSDCSVDRDRRMISSYDLRYHAREVWTSAMGQRPDLFPSYMAMLETGAPEVQGLSTYDVAYLPGSFVDHAVDEFEKRHGKLAVPVGNLAESADLEHFGRRGIVVTGPMRAVLEQKMGSLYKVREALKTEATRTYSWHELTAAQKSNLESAIRRLSSVEPLTLDEVSVCEFRSEDLRGLYSNEGIKLSVKVLDNPAECLATLIHEVSHRQGIDGDKAHVQQIESIWARIYTNMTQS
jgi:hypothetical protein